MNDILKTYMERFRENRHTLRRYTAFVLALAMITTLFVNWQLHGVGISMTAQYQCGEEEHTHTADCYTKVLTCGYEEGELENADELAAAAATSQPTVEAEPAPLALEPQIEFVPHEHTEDCYTEVQTLTCMEEEHVHGDDCFDPEDGSLICDKFEHTHDESCYTTEYELTCGLEEGELVEQVVEPTQSAELAAMAVAEPVALEPTVDTVEPIYHHHTDACYEEVLTCPLPEHHHTVACLSDTSADVETPEEWQAANAEAVMTGNWDEDLLSVAKTQLGYEQSEKNFEIDPADGVTLRYYSRYGQSYGNPYGEWDVMFLSYCLKYAGIPQSAIPQEASVLALRSSMSDMDWLLDGEDGSAANVGDIVIYNKYVTRTVAVDSSADGAADGLDDQFSMDAEGENGAELETSGAAALDTAPAAEDAPAADSVITPDLPDTANPEQPAAKPADSTGTSASGADTLIPSVASPAAEPQTTTVTDAVPVETVGIVSEADDDTLTVISGDVDGKVAEVTLSSAEVLAVVDVAAAQYADEMLSSAVDGALKAPDMLTLAGVEDDETGTPLDESWITKIQIKIDGTQHTVKDNASAAEHDLTVKDGGSVDLTYYFTIPETLPKDTYTLTYQLPAGFKLPQDGTAELQNQENQRIGTISITTDGKVTLKFDHDLSGTKTKGHFYVGCSVDSSKSESRDKITFPGSGTTIQIEKKTDLDLDKKGSFKGRTDDGKYILHYVVTAKSTNGSGKPIELSDYMNLQENSNFAKTATYQNITITKKDNKGNTLATLEKDKDFKVSTVTSNGLTDKEVADYNPGIKITAMDDKGLPALEANQRYVLEYDVVVDRTAQNDTNLSNHVFANGEVDKKDLYFHNEMSKSGSYDPEKNEITWTVTIMPNGASMNGYVLKDTLQDGCKMTGYFMVVDNNGKTLLEKNDLYKDQTEFSHTFEGKEYKEKTSYKYTVTYKTTAPANFNIGDKVNNTAELWLNGNKKWEASGDASYNDRGKTTEKKAKEDTKLTEDKANNKVFTLPWSLKVIPPIVWDSKDSVNDNRLEIKDCINDPWVSTGTNENNDHYAILKDLQQDIIDNLVVTLKDNTKITYDQLTSKGLRLEVRYYTGRNVDTNTNVYTLKTADSTTKTVPVDLEQTKIKSFKLVFHKESNFDTSNPVESVEITSYNTMGDFSGLGEGQTIYFKNESNGSSGQYEYTIPGNSTLKLIKMSANQPPEEIGSNGRTKDYYKAENVTVTSGNGEDGKTYIYYQLKLVTNRAKLTLPATVTDQLPEHVKYVDGSATLVVQNYYNEHDDYYFDHVSYTGANSSWNNWISLSDACFFEHTYDSTKNTLTFTLKDELKYIAETYTSFCIRFAVEVDDSIWDSRLDKETRTFANSAEWTGVGRSETKTNVEHEAVFATKSGEYMRNSNTVNYSIVINPDKRKLGDAEKITLIDKLIVKDGDQNTAALIQSSVNLYSYDAQTKTKGALIPNDVYDVDYEETNNTGGDQNWYILTIKVPNAHSYLLEYQYRNTSNTEYEMKNTAELESHEAKEVIKRVEHLTLGGSATTEGLTIHKVNSQNISDSLSGAEFKLEYFDAANGEYKTLQESIEASTLDPSSFYLSFTKDGTISTEAGSVQRPYNILYRLTETKAPEGFAKDSKPHYFIWTTNAANKENAYTTAVGSHDESKTGVSKNDIKFYYEGEHYTLTVKNTSNRLVIQKLWEDKDGNAIEGTSTKLPPNITVELYKRTTRDGEGVPVKTLTLTQTNGWKETYDVPVNDLSCYFYVKETSTGQTYDVSYSNNNVQGTGTIVVTNKEKENAGYELPSTGGTGTLPYTAVGGTMMLSALAYSFIHRKRRREGRADD